MKKKCGISRSNLSRAPDREHTHLVLFERGTDCCLGYFQHPPSSAAALARNLRAAGEDPTRYEQLYATADRSRAIYAEVFAEERELDASAERARRAEARRVRAALFRAAGLDPRSRADCDALVALVELDGALDPD